MASRNEVKAEMAWQLENDSRVRFRQAGAAWESLPLGFYYADEVGVDLAMRAIMLRILQREHKTLPNAKWNELVSSINRDTLTSDSIDTITRISAFAAAPVLDVAKLTKKSKKEGKKNDVK